MTPLQTHALTALIAAAIAVAITYAVLTSADPDPLPIDPDVYKTEERMRMRDSIVQPDKVRDSLEAVKSTISERPKQRDRVNEKWAEKARERVNVADSVMGVELIERIDGWRP